MKRLLLAFLVVLFTIPSIAQENAAPGEIRVGRYTTIAGVPPKAQSNPLDAVVVLNFPRHQVHSVRDAVTYLLLRTGYRLTDAEQLGPEVKEILALPLPEVHRKMGPYSVRAALLVLLGTPFQLTTDPLRRQIAYDFDASAPATVAQDPVPIDPTARIEATAAVSGASIRVIDAPVPTAKQQ